MSVKKTRLSRQGIRMAAVDCVSLSSRNNANKVFVEVLREDDGVTVIVEDDSTGLDEGEIGRFLDPHRIKFYPPEEIHVSSTTDEFTYKAHWYKSENDIQLSALQPAEWEEGIRFEITGLRPPDDFDNVVTENWLTNKIKTTINPDDFSAYSEFELEVNTENKSN